MLKPPVIGLMFLLSDDSSETTRSYTGVMPDSSFVCVSTRVTMSSHILKLSTFSSRYWVCYEGVSVIR
jgi:hypothetical protein